MWQHRNRRFIGIVFDPVGAAGETNPLGQTHRWRYDDWGNCIEEVDAADGVTRREYDEHHQLVRIEEPTAEDEDPVVWTMGHTPRCSHPAHHRSRLHRVAGPP